jgi:hypothetical protein
MQWWVILYFKDYLREGIQIIKITMIHLFGLIKLDRIFFNTKGDIYVCDVYIWECV